MPFTLTYIAHGQAKTGGYYFEKNLIQHLSQSLNTKVNYHRSTQNYEGIIGFIKLWFYGLVHTKAGCNITVQRLFVPVFLKALLHKAKVLLVWHHYDKREPRSLFYHLNARVVLYVLKLNLPQVKVVVVSKFWQNWFIAQGVNPQRLVIYPNLFEVKQFETYANQAKHTQQVYLGQYSAKCSNEIFEIASQLNKLGYHCFFSSPISIQAPANAPYEIKCLSKLHLYESIAKCTYAVMFSKFNEGWNRSAHESVLCGLTLIAKPSGGLTQLVTEAGMFLVNGVEEAIQIIQQNKLAVVNPFFIQNYNQTKSDQYLTPILSFITHDIR